MPRDRSTGWATPLTFSGRMAATRAEAKATRAGLPAAQWRALSPAEAVERLLAAHGGRLHAIASRLCRSRDDAADLVQETFLQVFRKWRQFAGDADPMSWLYTIAVRACRRMHRRRAGAPKDTLSLDADAPFASRLVATVDGGNAIGAELRERLEAAIPRLPTTYRLPLVLKDVVGMPVEGVAGVLGVTPTTVRTRVHRARLRLRSELARGLPMRAMPPAAYARAVCLDLLRAKQHALDAGVPMPGGDALVCDRCRAVFATMDLTQDVCRSLADGTLPAALRRRILARLE
jgi:RNA polymerase sigma-70 factor (ECF subfamily)